METDYEVLISEGYPAYEIENMCESDIAQLAEIIRADSTAFLEAFRSIEPVSYKQVDRKQFKSQVSEDELPF